MIIRKVFTKEKFLLIQKLKKLMDINLVKLYCLVKILNLMQNQNLEIYADDVKCSHGSTSGNLDEDAIFYLMSRGLNYQTI